MGKNTNVRLETVALKGMTLTTQLTLSAGMLLALGKRTGISQYNYRAHYLAYHDGAGGYIRGTWKKEKMADRSC